MVRISLLLIVLIVAGAAKAQMAPGKYWVEFTDKDNTPYSVSQPEVFLSDRSIERRINQNIDIDQTDLPVDPAYIDQVLALGDIQMLYSSRWFNALAIAVEDSTLIEEILQLPFVAGVRSVVHYGREEFPEKEPIRGIDGGTKSNEIYGTSLHQIEMLNGHLLHNEGYTGNGIRIGVMDGGFNQADSMDAFAPLIADGRLIGTYDFVGVQENVFYSSSHGTRVWSTMASYWPDSIIGSAYSSEYMLFLTEDVTSEFQLEETNWIAAAEMADSAGVDVLNTSLGYTLFDDSLQSHSYADMDGETTWITRGGNMAARKGMLVINSAGNSGAGSWYYIGAPADADSVLAIGAARADSSIAAFSSRGPTFDGRVKPNVCAQGVQTVMANTNNTVMTGNGTSFSSPVLSGLAACLWQTAPEATNMQVFRAIEESAHLFNNPNDSLGYGLPNFWLAKELLSNMVSVTEQEPMAGLNISAFPNPFRDEVQIQIDHEKGGRLFCRVYDLKGRLIYDEQFQVSSGRTLISLSDFKPDVAEGQYLLQLEIDGIRDHIKLQKLK